MRGVYVTVGSPSVSVSSINRSSGVRRVCCNAPCGQEISIDNGGLRALSSNCAAARGCSTALSSKCGQCYVYSQVNEAEHRHGILFCYWLIYNDNMNCKSTDKMNLPVCVLCLVDSDACALWSVSLHGSYFTARRSGQFITRTTLTAMIMNPWLMAKMTSQGHMLT